MTEGWVKVPHSVWELDLTLEERCMFLFLLDCEDRFNKRDDWFCLTIEDLFNIGFGKNKTVLRKTRKSLIEKGLIEYIKGISGKKSKYKIIRKGE